MIVFEKNAKPDTCIIYHFLLSYELASPTNEWRIGLLAIECYSSGICPLLSKYHAQCSTSSTYLFALTVQQSGNCWIGLRDLVGSLHLCPLLTALPHCPFSLPYLTGLAHCPPHCSASLPYLTAPPHWPTSLPHLTGPPHCPTSLPHLTAPDIL